MKESPILFNGDMVRAILDGRKTQTRRVLKPQPKFTLINADRYKWQWGDVEGSGSHEAFVRRRECESSPMGRTGDRLWVRETFKPIASGEVKDGYGEVRYGHAYQADGATVWQKQTTIIHDMTGQPDTGPMQFKQKPWKPSIHMPQAAARIWLEITDVRVERLHDIRQRDALAEGIKHSTLNAPTFEFCWLWQSIYGADSWDANPWVWAITFKKCEA